MPCKPESPETTVTTVTTVLRTRSNPSNPLAHGLSHGTRALRALPCDLRKKPPCNRNPETSKIPAAMPRSTSASEAPVRMLLTNLQ